MNIKTCLDNSTDTFTDVAAKASGKLGTAASDSAGANAEAEAFAQKLLRWYDGHKRSLPWREDPTPYHVWLSEIMLQQTRVEAVRDYYARFIEALPAIEDLAAADEDVYLKLWEGLGYYSRVRNLHKAAVQIVEEHGGQMPQTAAELAKLPGIGPYTSAAIASICFDERTPAIDGNLLRVFARMTGCDLDVKSAPAKASALTYYLETFPQDRCGDYNQALMDLGATVCLPNAIPLCESCPWQDKCEAHRTGRETELPVIAKKAPRVIEQKTVFLIYYDQKLALRKRPEEGLLAGLYEFPNAEGKLDKVAAADYVQQLGFSSVRIKKLPAAKHIFSHREWHMTGWQVLADEWEEFESGSPKEHELFLASADELDATYSIPSAFRKYREEIREDYL